jgi:hypothetical protein
VQGDLTQPLRVILLLDRSVTAADWIQLRSVANNLVDSLRPVDQMAILSFANNVQVVQGPSSDTTQLKAALAAVQPLLPSGDGLFAPSTNTLYQALQDATNLASTLLPGRIALLAVTNGADDSSGLALDQVIDLLSTQQTPVHFFGFGPAAPGASLLTAIAQISGGTSGTVSGAGDVAAPLQSMMLLLQQGYRIDYTSRMSADNSEKPLVIRLATNPEARAAEGSLVATARPVTVMIPGITAGETIAGGVNLTAQATTPAPIASVVYRLNGEILAEVDDLTANILWNSDTVEPGAYTLQVEVTDEVGNQGSSSVNFRVVTPISLLVELAPASGPYRIGDRLQINMAVESFTNDARVEVFVDDELVGSDERPPYQVSFDTSELLPGSRNVRVEARNRLDYVATALFELPLAAPPVTESTTGAVGAAADTSVGLPSGTATDGAGEDRPIEWGWWLWWGGLSALGAAALLILASIARVLATTKQTEQLTPVRLTFANMGNAPSSYLLRGEDPANILKFQFSMNGTPLGTAPVARADQPAFAAVAGPTLAQTPAVSQRPSQPPVSTVAPAHGGAGLDDEYAEDEQNGSGLAQNLSGVGGKIEEVSAVGRIIADLLLTVAYLLPRNIGSPLRMVAMQIRRGQMFTRRISTVRKQVDRLNKTRMGKQLVDQTSQGVEQAGRAATSPEARQSAMGAGQAFAAATVGAGGSAASALGRTATRAYDLSSQTAARGASHASPFVLSGGGGARGDAGNGNGNGSIAKLNGWVYLPRLAPAEIVNIDVLVGTAGYSPKTSLYPFRIVSRALADDEAEPVVDEGVIQIKGASQWRRIFLWLALLAVIAIVAVIAFLLFAG